MSDSHPKVGQALADAIARAEALRKSSDRKPRTRVLTEWGDYEDGLVIVSRIAARTNAEFEVQSGIGVRYVPFDELDARAGELVSLVEAAASEIVAAVAAAPKPGPRPSEASDLASDDYEALREAASQSMFDVADGFMRNVPASLSRPATAEACAAAALRVAALMAVAAHIDLPNLTEMLADNVRQLHKSQGLIRPPGTRAH